MSKIKFTIITLFEDALRPYLETSMMWKAKDKGIAEFEFVNLRDFGLGPHKSVDDTPYGGGDGMLLRPEPVYAAIESVFEKAEKEYTSQHGSLDGYKKPEVILPTPAGKIWNQETARMFASSAQESTSGVSRHYVILCPHYEGYDERILELVDHKISLGKYVLTGGELPALIIIDSVVRLIPGVLGGEQSAEIESFSDGNNIEYPQYTKPAEFRGMKVPEVLLSGDHGKVDAWRKAHEKTLSRED